MNFIGEMLYSWFSGEKSEAENCYYQGSTRTLDYYFIVGFNFHFSEILKFNLIYAK